MKICPNCSAELDDNAKYCSMCGAAATEDQKSEEKTEEQNTWEQQASYSQNGYSQAGSAQSGYGQTGHAQTGYGQTGYAQSGYGRQAADQAYPPSTNGFAIAGFVCAFFFPILGIIFSAIAMKQIDERNEGGKGLAIAGLVLSIIWIGIALIILMTGACTVSTLYSYYL